MVYRDHMASTEPTARSSDLRSRLEFETLVVDLSTRFISLPPGEVDGAIEDALGSVCELLGIDYAVLWQWSGDHRDVLLPTHSHPARGEAAAPASLDQTQYPWVLENVRAGRTVVVPSLEELPSAAAVDRRHAGLAGIKSSLAVPLIVGGEVPVGALAFNTLRAHRDWPDEVVTRLGLVAQVFTNALARKRSDEALRESEERLALAADSAEAGLWTLDYGTGIFWATPRARAIFGYSADTVIDMDVFRASVHPDDWSLVDEAVVRSARSGEPLRVEYRIRLSDGGVRWIASRGRPHFAPAGAPDTLRGVSFDISGRRRAEEALVASDARLNAGAELAGLGFYELDYGEGIAYPDDRFRELIGLPPDESEVLKVLGFWTERMHPDDRQRLLDEREQLHDGVVERLSLEYRFLHPTRGQRWLHHLARVATRDADGRRVRVYGVLRDVTERRTRAGGAARERGAPEAGAELAGLGFYEVDFAGRSVYLDDRFRELCGVPPDREDGLGALEFWMERLHPDDRDRVLETRERLHDGRLQTLSIEYRYLHPTEGERWIKHVASVAVRDDAGRTTSSYGVLRDVTEQKRAEDELRDLSRRLISAHEEERALLARELHDDVSQRLAVLAIDAGRAELAAPDAAQAETMTAIREGLVRLSEDIHSLAYQLHPSVLEELGLVEALRAECERRARQGSLDIRAELDPTPDVVPRDVALCLFRVAQEALNNAARHSGAPTATVTLRRMNDGLVLAVRDDGLGFDTECARRRGSLGLSSMRERVRLVNGTLDVESAPGQGTTVVAWAPTGEEES